MLGAAILFAVVLVALVTSTNNYNKEAQFRKLNAVKDDITVSVIRKGASNSIDIKDLVIIQKNLFSSYHPSSSSSSFPSSSSSFSSISSSSSLYIIKYFNYDNHLM